MTKPTARPAIRPSPRPLSRAVVICGLLLLGVVAAGRLEVSYLPSQAFPELRVWLSMQQEHDVDLLTRRWVQPLEAAIRAAGGTTSVAGEVGPRHASLRVRLGPGVDAERKAARLESELAAFRRALGRNGTLSIEPAGPGAGDVSLVVWLGTPGTADDTSAPTAPSARIDLAAVEALRDLPEIRRVEVAGTARRGLRWSPRAGGVGTGTGTGSTLAALRDLAEDGDTVLGTVTSSSALTGVARRTVLWTPPAGVGSDRWIRLGDRTVTADAASSLALAEDEDAFRARVDGRPGVVLQVTREHGTSPLALERSVRRALQSLGLRIQDQDDDAEDDAGDSAEQHDRVARILWSEAEPIRAMLRRLALASLWAMVLGALAVGLALGWTRGSASGSSTRDARWRAALTATAWQLPALPLAVAAAANVFWLLGLPIDLTTAIAATVGVGAALLFQAVRLGAGSGPRLAVWTILAAWMVPVAVRLLGRDLGALLAAPVLAFAAVASAGTAALLLLPQPPMPVRPWAQSVIRPILRNPWTVALLALALSYGLFAVLGERLLPRSGRLMPASADLVVRLGFVEGTTLDEAAERMAVVERHVLRQAATRTAWGWHDRSRAVLAVRVEDAVRNPMALDRLAQRWRAQLTSIAGSVEVAALGGLGGGGGGSDEMRFESSLRTKAEADDAMTFYRFVLRSTDLGRLRAAHAKILATFSHRRWEFGPHNVQSQWGQPAPRLELVPLDTASPADVTVATAALRERIAPARGAEVQVPGASERPVTLTLADPDAPDLRDDPPQVRDVLRSLRAGLGSASGSGSRTERVLAPSELFRLEESFGSPTIRREDGAYVLPVTVHFAGFAKGEILWLRPAVERAVLHLEVAGVDVERPPLVASRWTEARMRLLAIAAALPLLLLALASIRLDSVPLALAALSPLAVAVGMAAGFLALLDQDLDEVSLLALAGALAAVTPLLLEVAAALRVPAPRKLAASVGYHWLVRRLPHAFAALASWSALLLGAGLGLAAERSAWAPPLRLAGTVGAVALVAGFLVLPGLLRAVDRMRFYDRKEARRRAQPIAWTEPGMPTLEVDRLTKVYGNGFRALDGVSFRLEPGIVGLLGPNGAGKTTLLRHLCGLLQSSRGRVLYRGVPLDPDNLAAYRDLVGFLPQEFDAYEGFTAESFLDYWALQRGLIDPASRAREIEDLLRMVGLEQVAHRTVREFSGGMRRRIGIARSLLGAPPILLVDEPTTGLDVESRNRLRESLLAAAGDRIILFSTHIASDVAAAASRILLLHQGKLLFDGPSGALIDQAQGRVFETLVDDENLRDFAAKYRVTTRLRTLEGVKVRAVAAHDQEPAGEIVRPNLEEAYLAKLGRTAQRRSRVKSLLEL